MRVATNGRLDELRFFAPRTLDCPVRTARAARLAATRCCARCERRVYLHSAFWRIAAQPLKDASPGAYVTVLGTPDYLPGVRVLVRGQLRRRTALPALTRRGDVRLMRCGSTARRIR